MLSDHTSVKGNIYLSSTKILQLQILIDFFVGLVKLKKKVLILWEACYGYLIIKKLKNLLSIIEFTDYISYIGYVGVGTAIIP
jgi:hypothetical protein